MPSPAQGGSAPRFRNADTQPILIQNPQPGPQEPPPAARPRRAKTVGTWIGGTVAVLILAGVAASDLRDRPIATPGDGLLGASPAREIPPTLRPYYDRAVTGDASAMRMLGTMYYNGLNVPQDTKEGLRWYRKAAAAGSVAARKDLEQLGLSQEEEK